MGDLRQQRRLGEQAQDFENHPYWSHLLQTTRVEILEEMEKEIDSKVRDQLWSILAGLRALKSRIDIDISNGNVATQDLENK